MHLKEGLNVSACILKLKVNTALLFSIRIESLLLLLNVCINGRYSDSVALA